MDLKEMAEIINGIADSGTDLDQAIAATESRLRVLRLARRLASAKDSAKHRPRVPASPTGGGRRRRVVPASAPLAPAERKS